MNRHFVGQGQNSAENGREDPPLTGTSLVVRLFVALACWEVDVHAPQNEFVTVAVEAEERYCLKCFNAGIWDVWIGQHDGLEFRLGRCRVCGKEMTL